MNNINAQNFVNEIYQYIVKHITPIAIGYFVEGYKSLSEAWGSMILIRFLGHTFIGNSHVSFVT